MTEVSESRTPFPLINAVRSGKQVGITLPIGSDNELTLHKAGFSFIKNQDITAIDTIARVIVSSPELPAYFHVYAASDLLIRKMGEYADLINLRIRRRIQLKFPQGQSLSGSSCPSGFQVVPISYRNIEAMKIFNINLQDKFWQSEEDFLKNGFGFCVLNGSGTPVSICYSACVADNTAEIDIATLSEYQRKGLAVSALEAFVHHCQQQGIVANWDCFEENVASLRTAERMGFKQTMNYEFLSIFNKNKS